MAHVYKFDVLKRRAKGIIDQECLSGLDCRSTEAFEALARMALTPYVVAERPGLVAFAEAFEIGREFPPDYVANAAKFAAAKTGSMVPKLDISLILLKAREESKKIIDNWDVRMVGKLVELFPTIVPAKCAKMPVTCYIDDTDEGDWIVEFGAIAMAA